MSERHRTIDEVITAGTRVIYTRMQRPRNTEWHGTVVRMQAVNGRCMCIVSLDAEPKPRQVGIAAVRKA